MYKRQLQALSSAVHTSPASDSPRFERLPGWLELRKQREGRAQSERARTVHLWLIPAAPCAVRNVNGAGDCLLAGCVAGLVQGQPLLPSVAAGVLAAKCACESVHNVPPELKGRALGGSGAVQDCLRQAVPLVWHGAGPQG